MCKFLVNLVSVSNGGVDGLAMMKSTGVALNVKHFFIGLIMASKEFLMP